MAPSVIQKGSLSLISNYTPEEFAKAPKLIETSAKVKQAKKGGFVYLEIVWAKETSLKPPKPITAKVALGLIETVIKEYENLPQGRLAKRINLNAEESIVPGRTKRKGWIAFQVKGELQEARGAVSCFQQMLKRRFGTAVEVRGTNFAGPLEVLYPVESDVQ